VAKRSRRAVRPGTTTRSPSSGAAPVPTDPASSRTSRRARPRGVAEPTTFERFRTPIVAGVAAIGLLVIGYFFFFAQGSASAAYNCLTELTPAPAETLTPAPSFVATPSPAASPTMAASASPSAAPSATEQASPSPAASPTALPSPTPLPTPRLGFATAILGRDHVATGSTITYGFCPPDSGNHYNEPPLGPVPAKVYGPEKELPPGEWVHNLEHGYIVLLYRCPSGTPGSGDCISADEYSQLQAFFNQAPDSGVPACPNKVVVARFDSMDTSFAELAWGRAFLFDQFDLDTANTFLQQWMDHPAVPERYLCDGMGAAP
jgi:hypothetical protein